jgi:hypothetical protein
MPRGVFNPIRVASPCPVSWGSMHGDDRVRFCRTCRLHVYNLSEMTWAEVQARLRAIEGRTCVTFYQRPDGTMLTRDCPLTRVERVRRWAGRSIVAMACLLGFGTIFATLFGDNIRQLFGASTGGALAGNTNNNHVAPSQDPVRRPLRDFGKDLDSY